MLWLIISMAAFWLWSWAHMRILLRHERQLQTLIRWVGAEEMKEEYYGTSDEHPDP